MKRTVTAGFNCELTGRWGAAMVPALKGEKMRQSIANPRANIAAELREQVAGKPEAALHSACAPANPLKSFGDVIGRTPARIPTTRPKRARVGQNQPCTWPCEPMNVGTATDASLRGGRRERLQADLSALAMPLPVKERLANLLCGAGVAADEMATCEVLHEALSSLRGHVAFLQSSAKATAGLGTSSTDRQGREWLDQVDRDIRLLGAISNYLQRQLSDLCS